MGNAIAAILFGVSVIASIALFVDKPLALVALVVLWWVIFRVGVWMTRDRDQQEQTKKRRRETPL